VIARWKAGNSDATLPIELCTLKMTSEPISPLNQPHLRRPAFFDKFSGLCIGLLLICGTALGEDAAVPVEVIIAIKSTEQTREMSLTGTVTAKRRARLSSRTTGLVMELKVDAGSPVKQGDVLMTLDTRMAEISLQLIGAEINQAKIELAEAVRRVDEIRELVRKGGYPKSQAETLKSTLSISEAKVKQLELRESEQLETIARHKLVAPFDGVISRKLSEAGEWVTTGTPVLELVEMQQPWFDLQTPQESLGPLKQAEKVSVRLDAFPDLTFDADIAVTVPVKDAVSRTFLTRLQLKDSQGLATPGMSGTADIAFRSGNSNSVQVPRDAIVRFADGSAKVWVVQMSDGAASGKVQSRLVKTAGRLAEMIEVVDGLSGGECVVVKGNEALQEEQLVTVQNPGNSTNAAAE